MFVYSVTISIEKTFEAGWLAWMQRTHIPEIMATGYFADYKIHKLLDPQVDETLATYNFHYRCQSLAAYEAYVEAAAPALRAAHETLFKDRFVAFRTLLEEIG
ncbi:MAG: hypothetical protein OHK0039_01650 [Bacteroidia bacterium]